MIGGLIRWIVDRKKADKDENAGRGVLFCSGLIAGEGLVGILLAVFAVVGLDKVIDLSRVLNTGFVGGLVLLITMIVLVFMQEKKPKEKKAE